MYPLITLKPAKEPTLASHHPWLFSGALQKIPAYLPHGSLVYIANQQNKILATGTYSKSSTIAVRVFEFKETIIDETWFINKINEAQKRRELLGYGLIFKSISPKSNNSPSSLISHPSSLLPTTGYRLIFGEADGIPGLIIDRYHDVFVLQISTAGMANLKNLIVTALIELFKPKAIIERSDIPVRKEEKLEDSVAVLYGQTDDLVEFSENGHHFLADIIHGQKTGFFLDQKDLRQEISRFAQNRTVLNLFSYTGSNAVYALKAGANHVHHVDSSKSALEMCSKQIKLNQLTSSNISTEEADIFQWLAEQPTSSSLKANSYKLKADCVILDPPALIKSKRDQKSGFKAYHFLNRAALRLIKDKGIFITSSCSHFFSEEDFIVTLRRASLQAGVKLHILKKVTQSPDHPSSIYFPESNYLKSFVCYVEKQCLLS